MYLQPLLLLFMSSRRCASGKELCDWLEGNLLFPFLLTLRQLLSDLLVSFLLHGIFSSGRLVCSLYQPLCAALHGRG